ncbi:hypothetical protein [Corynebacterium phocae]|uniref:hypothetical protein n=1 Tax=Corynebacterium phocae TaxID=161895 RepID=UPI00123AB18E|nr:hypothetical protein [Corynebacterium phocae]KAA8727977.1 hypothetical protein F4V58_01025 [Corynebacterium phocae]
MTPSKFSITQQSANIIEKSLTNPRLNSYSPPLVTVQPGETAKQASVRLYQWNAEVAAALWPVMHVFEVTVRNAASEAINYVHGPNWAHDVSFQNKLPNPRPGLYNPRKDLRARADHFSTTGKIIPELKMAFWEKMFTARHDNDFWKHYLEQVFPNTPDLEYYSLRGEIREKYANVRKIRNRLGHHESVSDPNRFDLHQIFDDMMAVLEWRDPVIRNWVDSFQTVEQTLSRRP